MWSIPLYYHTFTSCTSFMRLSLRNKIQSVLFIKPNMSLRLVFITFATLLLVVIIGSSSGQSSRSFIDNPNEETIPAGEFFRAFPGKKSSASVVKIGLYLDSIYDLDLSKLTFKARGWIWYKWIKAPLINGTTDPGHLGMFDLNFLDEIDVNQVKSSEKPVWYKEPSGMGTFWNETSFDAKLSAPTINLRNYPFDRQQLKILVTNPVHTTDELIYQILQFRLPSRVFNISGYRLDGVSFSNDVRVFTSNFGDSSAVSWRDDSATSQSQATFSIFISRNPITSFFQYALPMFIVNMLAVSTIRLADSYWEVKIPAAPAATLSLIFLQNTFQQDLPQVSYMTCMDLMFILSYLICFLCFADSLSNAMKSTTQSYSGLYGKLGALLLSISPIIVSGWLYLSF